MNTKETSALRDDCTTEVTPVQKVIHMLEGMLTKGKEPRQPPPGFVQLHCWEQVQLARSEFPSFTSEGPGESFKFCSWKLVGHHRKVTLTIAWL